MRATSASKWPPLPDLSDVRIARVELEGRCPSNHLEIADLRQAIEDLFRNAHAQRTLIPPGTHVDEGQDRNRGLCRECGRRLRRAINQGLGARNFNTYPMMRMFQMPEVAVTIADVGHYPMLEKPEEFNKKLTEVLKEFEKK